MSGDLSDAWVDDPCVEPPFYMVDNGNSATISDQNGRTFMYDYRARDFVRELVDIMNENAERIAEAWKRSVRKAKGNVR